MCDFPANFFFGVRGSNSIVLILLLRLFPSDQKHSTRNCIKFADVNFLVLNVDSREEKKKCDCVDTESRNSTRKRSNFVKSHYNYHTFVVRIVQTRSNRVSTSRIQPDRNINHLCSISTHPQPPKYM